MKFIILDKINTPSDLKECTISELSVLAQEIRTFLIEHVTQSGGHLAPNLGVIELTLALHYVFNSPQDGFIWDVGHQAYTHKILTDRKHMFSTLRKKNGLSGYPSPQESIHDIVHAGHSSTSISLGVGVASAKKLMQDQSATISIIGDGSFTSGMVYEALNDASWRKIPLLIILNDNKMSISENVGGIAKHLNTLRTNKIYLSFKKGIFQKLSYSVWGQRVFQFLFAIKSMLKKVVFRQSNIFENLGVKYLGPFDGHHLPQLISLLQEVRDEIQDVQEPMILHILTEKGKGYKEAQENPTHYHGISGKDDSIPLNPKQGASWSKIFGKIVCELALENEDIIAITAAMREGTGLVDFSNQFPERFIDVGIAEQHAVTCAAGLAIQGKRPIVAIYSTFLQRSYDQIIHDVAIAKYPVIFCLDRSGIVPGDGKTHQGVFDIAYLRTIPEMIVMSPLNEIELKMMLQQALSWSKPVAIRYPKDVASHQLSEMPALILGNGVELYSGTDGVIVIFGSLFNIAQQTRELLLQKGQKFAIYHCRFAKPIATEMIEYLKQFSKIVVLEEGIAIGGIGEYFKTQLIHQQLYLFNVGDQIPNMGTRESLLDDFEFNPEMIVQRIQ